MEEGRQVVPDGVQSQVADLDRREMAYPPLR